jgi:predicted amidophosphoribosyltransferase
MRERPVYRLGVRESRMFNPDKGWMHRSIQQEAVNTCERCHEDFDDADATYCDECTPGAQDAALEEILRAFEPHEPMHIAAQAELTRRLVRDEMRRRFDEIDAEYAAKIKRGAGC